jgi:hypothetical protein
MHQRFHHTHLSPREIRYSTVPTNNSFSSDITRPTAPSLTNTYSHRASVVSHKLATFSAHQFPPPTLPGLLEHTSRMSRPMHRWGSDDRHGSDDDYDYVGSSSREWRTPQAWSPQHESQPQLRNLPATSSWQSTKQRQRWWHRDAVATLRQSSARALRQQQSLLSAEVSSSSASVLPWRSRMRLRRTSKSHFLVQAGTGDNATTVGSSPRMNLLRNNDAWGPPGFGRTLTSGQQLDERDKNERRFTADGETGTTRNCRHGYHVTLMSDAPSANAFLAVPMLSINRGLGARLENETLAVIAKTK